MKITTIFSHPQEARDSNPGASIRLSHAHSERALDEALARYRTVRWGLAVFCLITLGACGYVIQRSPSIPTWLGLPLIGLTGVVVFSLYRTHLMSHQVLLLEAQMLELRSKGGRSTRSQEQKLERMSERQPGFSNGLKVLTEERAVRQCHITPGHFTPKPVAQSPSSARALSADYVQTLKPSNPRNPSLKVPAPSTGRPLQPASVAVPSKHAPLADVVAALPPVILTPPPIRKTPEDMTLTRIFPGKSA